jgi:hypothetical protein
LLGLLLPATAPRAECFEPQTAQECLQATVRIKTTDGAGHDSRGCGFFLNEGAFTYVYTAAHLIAGADKIEMVDHAGALVTGIEWIEALAGPCGRVPDDPAPGDGVRLKLAKRRELALAPATDWQSLTPGHSLLVLGADDGVDDDSLTVKLRQISNGILRYDFKTPSNSGGGAVVDAQTFKVVALNTRAPKTLRRVDPFKRMLGTDEEGDMAIGIELRNPEWEKFATRDYLAQHKAIQRLRQNLELMILLSYMVPTANGLHSKHKDMAVSLRPELHVASPDPFVAGMTIGDAIRHHQDKPLMKKLFDLRDQNIKLCSQDLFRLYLAALDAVAKSRQAIIADLRKDPLSCHHRALLTNRLLSAGDTHYAAWLAACQAWFQQKSCYGGTIPLEEWETLPPCGAMLAKEIKLKLRDE